MDEKDLSPDAATWNAPVAEETLRAIRLSSHKDSPSNVGFWDTPRMEQAVSRVIRAPSPFDPQEVEWRAKDARGANGDLFYHKLKTQYPETLAHIEEFFNRDGNLIQSKVFPSDYENKGRVSKFAISYALMKYYSDESKVVDLIQFCENTVTTLNYGKLLYNFVYYVDNKPGAILDSLLSGYIHSLDGEESADKDIVDNKIILALLDPAVVKILKDASFVGDGVILAPHLVEKKLEEAFKGDIEANTDPEALIQQFTRDYVPKFY